jgi:hypothetical protein
MDSFATIVCTIHRLYICTYTETVTRKFGENEKRSESLSWRKSCHLQPHKKSNRSRNVESNITSAYRIKEFAFVFPNRYCSFSRLMASKII